MDIPGSKNPTRHRTTPSSDRLLGSFPHAPPDSSAVASTSAAGDELHEDDLFWSGESAAESPVSRNIPSSPSSSSSSVVVSRLSNNSRIRSFAPAEGFGILAALPEDEASSLSVRGDHSGFFHKASVSSSSSSSPSSASRLIPIAPKPPQDRITPISSVKYHQSAPVNVPLLSEAMRRPRDFFGEVGGDEDGEGDGDDSGEAEMLPPHEMVVRSLAKSPRLSCSVLEGAGRTLKGRDLRQVRNAIWRQTGFLD